MTFFNYYHPQQNLPPVECAPPEVRPMIRNDLRMRGQAVKGGARTYGVAVDVWVHGQHMWRSYGLDTATTCDDWVDANLGVDAPRNHDDGQWGVSGIVDIADIPVPTLKSCRPVEGLQAVSDLLYTLTAHAYGHVGSPGDMNTLPPVFSGVPNEASLRQRMARADNKGIVVAFGDGSGWVKGRALIVNIGSNASETGIGPVETWRAVLVRRQVKAGGRDVILPCGEVEFSAPAGAQRHILLRHAKRALNVTGWPAQRQQNTLTWHLSGAPYALTITEENHRGTASMI